MLRYVLALLLLALPAAAGTWSPTSIVPGQTALYSWTTLDDSASPLELRGCHSVSWLFENDHQGGVGTGGAGTLQNCGFGEASAACDDITGQSFSGAQGAGVYWLNGGVQATDTGITTSSFLGLNVTGDPSATARVRVMCRGADPASWEIWAWSEILHSNLTPNVAVILTRRENRAGILVLNSGASSNPVYVLGTDGGLGAAGSSVIGGVGLAVMPGDHLAFDGNAEYEVGIPTGSAAHVRVLEALR